MPSVEETIQKKRSTRNVFTYKDEYKHSKQVSNANFLVDEKEFPLNPLSQKYMRYWKQQKRRIVEGYWHDGKWMPGNLYFYVNFTKISLSKDRNAKGKVIAKPFLRDLEWEKAYVYAEARGFSGFADDDEYSCHNDLLKQPEDRYFPLPKECFTKGGKEKKFIFARDYLRRIHSKNLGKPLYQNNASNVIDLESRGNGKSYTAAGMMGAHNFITDGALDYDLYLAGLRGEADRMKTETLVGAIDAKYSTDLLEKMETCIEQLAGAVTFQGKEYRSPFHKAYTGSLYSGKKMIQAKVEVKIDGDWFKKGSGSMIHHRTFKDKPLAAAGTRNSLAILEEGMFMNNLKEAIGGMKDTTYDGPNKFGIIYIMGTGGGADGKTDEAMDVFYNPVSYDCLAFDDIWEESGEVGFFVPYKYGLNDFKDSEGITDDLKAEKYINEKREDLKKSNDRSALNKEQQNNPNAPSEAFLLTGDSVLPVSDLKEQLNWVKSKRETDDIVMGQLGELVMTQIEGGGESVVWKPDIENKLFSCGFKMDKSKDTNGAIRIWEHPQHLAEDGSIPYGLYIAGTDPYDQDHSSTASLGSTFIYKRFHHSEGVYDWPVAEYTARPGTADNHHEVVRRLLIYYNATCLYENERNSMKAYFQHNHSLHLLARQPDVLKATERTTVDRTFGIHMTDGIKDEIELYLRDWLLADAGQGKMNLHKIYSVPLLEELIYYNRDGNFDRFISIALTILHLLQKKQIRVDDVKKENLMINDPFFQRNLGGIGSRKNDEGRVVVSHGQSSFGALFN